MANPPDNNDKDKSIKTDRNLAQPSAVRPATADQAANSKQATRVDTDRAPRTENLAAKNTGAKAAPDDAAVKSSGSVQPPKVPTPPVPESQSTAIPRQTTAASTLAAVDGSTKTPDKTPELKTNNPDRSKLTREAAPTRPADTKASRTTGQETRVRSRLEKPAEPKSSTRHRPSRPLTRPADELRTAPEAQAPLSANRSEPAPERAPQRRAGPPPGYRDRQAAATPPPDLDMREKGVARPSDAVAHSSTERRLSRRAGPPPGHASRQYPADLAATAALPRSTPLERGRSRGPVEPSPPARRMRPPVGAKKVGRFLNRPAPAAAPLVHTAPSSGGSFGPLLLGLLLLAVVGWLAVDHYTPTIQEDLLARSRASLDDAGLANNTDVSIDGRNITLSGVVSSEEESTRAEEAVAGTFGVRSVTNELSIGEVAQSAELAEVNAPSFSVQTNADGISLSGAVSDQKFADALSAAAENQFSGMTLNNEIEVDTNATNPGWTSAVVELLPDLNSVENGSLVISEGTATISGIAADAQTRDALGDKANALLGAQLNVVNNVEAPSRSLPAFASITETDNEVILNGFMSEEGATAVAEAYQSSDKTVVNNISINELAETPAWIDNFNSAMASLQGVNDGKLTIARSGNVKIQGSVDTEEQKTSIGETVTGLFGAETAVSNELAVIPPPVVPTMTPFVFVQQTADSISVSGLLPESAADSLVQSYSATGKTVTNNITVDERVIQPEWADALGQSLERLDSIENSSVRIASNGTLVLQGEAATEQAKQFTAINVGTLFGNSVQVQNDLTVAPAEEVAAPAVVPTMTPFVSVKQSDETVTISGLLPEDAANSIVQSYTSTGSQVVNNITVDDRVMQPDWSEAAGESLSRLGSIENAGINIASDGSLTLSGEAESDQVKQFTAINIGTLFGNSVSLRNDISVKTPTIIQVETPDIKALLAELDLSGIRFRSGSAELDGNSVDILDDVVEVLKLSDDANILIAGHTDSRGNADYNFSLSADRAAAVQDYLINNGIPADRLTARGFGPNQPIATNDTAAGRALNRRIEIQLIGE